MCAISGAKIGAVQSGSCIQSSLEPVPLDRPRVMKEYSYPGYAFTTFPADPNIETTAFEVARGRSVARVYSVRQDSSDDDGGWPRQYRPSGKAVIDHAVKALSAGGQGKIDIPHHI
jgi:hypothetical protein